jgi:DUF4097 and DUF4098 domain-containing protein YvlB
MKRFLALMGLTLTMVALAPAQDNTGNRVVVPARNSTRPRQLRVSLQNSGITIKTHAGKDVIVESAAPANRRREERTSDGLRRIDIPFGGFDVTEEDNVITVHGQASMGGNLLITVPPDTSVQAKSQNGSVSIEGVRGEVEAASANGKIDLINVAGTVVADSQNGSIHATLDRVDQSKPLSFSSQNGSIEVTWPADTKANLKMRTLHGSIWTDFDMNVTGGRPVTSSGGSNARFEVKFDRTMFGTINGGGVEASFSTIHGRIVIKKK